jgi:hypothetical protein
MLGLFLGCLERETNNHLVEKLVRLRCQAPYFGAWHRLQVEVAFSEDQGRTTVESHEIAKNIRHEMSRMFPTLSDVMVQVNSWSEWEKVSWAYGKS